MQFSEGRLSDRAVSTAVGRVNGAESFPRRETQKTIESVVWFQRFDRGFIALTRVKAGVAAGVEQALWSVSCNSSC